MHDRRILMGVVGRPHGVRGLVHVHSYTADPDALAGYGPLVDDRGARWSLAWRGTGVAELHDAAGRPIADRTAAERLVNTRLYIDRAALPPAEEDEFYLADLVGMEAFGPDGVALGRVDAVHDYGAGTSLEIGPLLVPFTHACVPDVNVADRRITIRAPVEIEPSPSGRGQGEGVSTRRTSGAAHPHPGPLPEGEGAPSR